MSTPRDVDLENFCFYPFTQLLLQPTGVISPCCWNQQIKLGVSPHDSIQDAWNGEALRALRKEFLEGRPVSCCTQMREIGCHRWSRRPDGTPLNQIALDETQPIGPRRLDLRLNGKCNLRCVMCNVWEQPNGVFDQTDFWKKGPTELFPFLEEIDMLGGEPFIQPDTFKLIAAVAEVNSRCTWAFVTNGQYVFGDAITRHLDRVPIRWIQVSLDSVNAETYAKIRVNGKLQRALDTLEALREYRAERYIKGLEPYRLFVSMCVQAANWREVEELLQFARSKRLEVDLQFAYEPESVSLLSLGERDRREAHDSFTALAAKFGEAQMNSLILPLSRSF